MRTSLPTVVHASEKINTYLIGLFIPGIGSALFSFLLAKDLLPLEQLTRVSCVIVLAIVMVSIPAYTAISKLLKKIEDVEQRATTDQLSGLLNRRGAQAALQMEFGLISRERSRKAIDVSVIMIDLDHFKPLNDQCGHKAGDEALRVISRHIRGAFHRKTDICCRYGGDEFVIILPETQLEAALSMTEHLRQSVERTYSQEKVRITLSCGITAKSMAPVEISELLRNTAGDEALGMIGPILEVADQALYLSKERGRNRVTIRET